MADLTITAANVAPDAGYTFRDVIAGATITAGQPVYLDATDSNKAKLADNDASASTAYAIGVALHAALNTQPLRVITGGTYTHGGSSTTALIYVVSATAGGIAPAADLASGKYTTVLGVAISATKIKLNIFPSNVAQA